MVTILSKEEEERNEFGAYERRFLVLKWDVLYFSEAFCIHQFFLGRSMSMCRSHQKDVKDFSLGGETENGGVGGWRDNRCALDIQSITGHMLCKCRSDFSTEVVLLGVFCLLRYISPLP